ncbi:MAG: CopG family transcriptional regulator [Bradyrhizobium sp. 35-63-5]|nr:MAG: CopG family transcriptional regulator [Bradyrhizobium sp. 35-63-5]
MIRRAFCLGALLTVATIPLSSAAEPIRATLFKNPQCSCCEGYAAYLRENGFEVDVKPTNDLTQISRKAGVPENIQGCHTMFVDGYVVDGHVPVSIVRKLLTEHPAIAGITLPGMPSGSPGMGGPKSSTFTVYSVNKDGSPPKVYATE